jgi:hypothetical protein
VVDKNEHPENGQPESRRSVPDAIVVVKPRFGIKILPTLPPDRLAADITPKTTSTRPTATRPTTTAQQSKQNRRGR